MEEAIICAYLRGRAMIRYRSKMPEEGGGMAAVGLGSTQVQKYLPGGIVVACENSPLSTTISGDVEKLTKVLDAIKEDQPQVFSRRLAVDMAYHSRKTFMSLNSYLPSSHFTWNLANKHRLGVIIQTI